MSTIGNFGDPIRTALLLAAGTGSRLQPMTSDVPKCLTVVNGSTILERLVHNLCEWGFERLVVVVGHLDVCVRDYLDRFADELTIEYVNAPDYRTTNNLHSLWAARHVVQEPLLLVECDLVFHSDLLGGMLRPGRMAVSRILPWMNGTTVSLDDSRRVTRFHISQAPRPGELVHKTVNMYSFSTLSWKRVTRRLDQHVRAGDVTNYYEMVLAEMVADGSLAFEAVFFDNQRWYEIDTAEDLWEAERLLLRNNDSGTPGVVGSA